MRPRLRFFSPWVSLACAALLAIAVLGCATAAHAAFAFV